MISKVIVTKMIGSWGCDTDRIARHPEISGQELVRRAGGRLKPRRQYGSRLEVRKRSGHRNPRRPPSGANLCSRRDDPDTPDCFALERDGHQSGGAEAFLMGQLCPSSVRNGFRCPLIQM